MPLLFAFTTLAWLSASPNSAETKPLGEVTSQVFPNLKSGNKPTRTNGYAVVVTSDSVWIAAHHSPDEPAQLAFRVPNNPDWLKKVDWRIPQLQAGLRQAKNKNPNTAQVFLYANPKAPKPLMERVIFNLHVLNLSVDAAYVLNKRLTWKPVANLNKEISSLFRRQNTSSDRHPKRPGHSGSKLIVMGSLSRAEITAEIEKERSRIQLCYEKQLVDQPDLNGKIVVKFVIAASGKVQTAKIESSSLHNTQVESCVQDIFLWLQFPKPNKGGIVIVLYPFLFKTKG